MLVESGAVRPDQLARALAERFGVDFVDLSVFDVDLGAVNCWPPRWQSTTRRCRSRSSPDDSVLLAMADPTNVVTLDEISMITGRTLRPAAARPRTSPR